MYQNTSIVATKYNLVFGYANILILIIKNIIVIPFYLHFFSLNTVGLWLASSNILTILSSIDLGLNIIVTQRLTVERANGNFQKFCVIFVSARFIFILISILFLFISLVYAYNVDFFFEIPEELKSQFFYSLVYTSIGLAFNIIIQVFASLCQSLKTTFETGLSFLIVNLLEILLLFVLLYNTESIASIGCSIVVASSINLIFHCFIYNHLSRKFNFIDVNLDKIIVNNLLKSSLPLFFSRITRAIVNNSQATILSIFINNQSAAIFEISVKLYKTVLMFLAPIGSSIFSSTASSYAIVNQSQIQEDFFIFKLKIKKVLVVFLGLACVLFTYISIINYNFIAIWVGGKSYGGNLLTILCLFSFFFQSLSRFLTFILNSFDIIRIISKYEIIEMIFRIILLSGFVSLYGIYGIPLSEIFSTGLILLPKLYYELKSTLKITQNPILIFIKEEFGFIVIGMTSIIISVIFSNKFDSFYSLFLVSLIYLLFTIFAVTYFTHTSKNLILNFIRSRSIKVAFSK